MPELPPDPEPEPEPMPRPDPKASDPIPAMPKDKILRIMPLGASITQGTGSKKSGYRGVLHQLLNKAGIQHVYVGSNSAQPGDLPEGQRQHEGHPGWTIAEIPGKTQGLQEKLNSWIPPAKPDYILILVGSNDINAKYKLAEIGTRIETLIDTLISPEKGLAKGSTVIIASLPMIPDAAAEAESRKYRDRIMDVVVKKKKAGLRVGYIDVNGALKAEHKTDYLHPNDKGFEIIGQMWFDRMNGK